MLVQAVPFPGRTENIQDDNAPSMRDYINYGTGTANLKGAKKKAIPGNAMGYPLIDFILSLRWVQVGQNHFPGGSFVKFTQAQ